MRSLLTISRVVAAVFNRGHLKSSSATRPDKFISYFELYNTRGIPDFGIPRALYKLLLWYQLMFMPDTTSSPPWA